MTAVNGWIDEGTGEWSRTDPDGTVWLVCPDGPDGHGGDVWTLAMRYRDIRLVSEHPSEAAAKKHRDDMVRAFAARSMSDYSRGR